MSKCIGWLPARYFRRRSQMPLRAYGSTPAVGSSRMTTFDPPTKARATESFLCIPPEEHKNCLQQIKQPTYQNFKGHNATHLTIGWSWICVCVEGQYRWGSAPSQPSLPPQTDPSVEHRTRCVLLLSTWNTPGQARVDYHPQNWSIQPWHQLICAFFELFSLIVSCRSEKDTYMLKRTLCCGHTPRLLLIELSSERMSLPMIYAVPEVGGKRPVRIDLKTLKVNWRVRYYNQKVK